MTIGSPSPLLVIVGSTRWYHIAAVCSWYDVVIRLILEKGKEGQEA